MAVAYLYEGFGGTQQYDDILSDLGDEPPEGLVLHVAGMTEAGKLRIVEVWESEDARSRFGERLFQSSPATVSTQPLPLNRSASRSTT